MRLSLLAVFAVLLIACTPAEAAPLIGAIVAAVGLTGTAATIATAVLTIGVGAGLQLVRNALRPRQKAQPPSGYEADVTLGGDVYQRAIFGRAATKGHFVYANTSGSVNQRLDQVYVVSGGWCDGLDGILLDTENLPLTQVDSGTGWTKYAVTLPDDGGTRRMWATFWDGRPDQASNATLVATANPSGRWTAAHRGRGQAYVHIEADYAASVESFAGLLNGNLLTFVVRGLRLYDLRKDTTAGGSGSHRWDDPSTWEFSEAPAVCLYNFMAGIFVNGQRVIGMGRARYRLLSAQFMAAANVCDETVSLPDGGTEPRYRLSLIVDDSPQFGQAVERMVQAMAGQHIEGPGYHGIQAGAAQVPVATITDADLSATAALSHGNNRSFFDLVNEVWGQFLDPAAGWQPQDYPAVIGDAGMKMADGGATLPSDLDCTQMPSGSQAQRCAAIALNRNRHERTARIPVGLKWWRLEPGDWIVWDSSRYGTVTFQAVDRTLDTDQHLILLSLQEVSASIFTAGTLAPVPLPPTPPGLPSRPTNISGLVLQQTTIEGADGQAIPALLVSWDAVADETIRMVEVYYRVKTDDDSGAITHITVPRPASGAWTGTTISGGLMAGTAYEVRTTITTFPARRVTYNDWLEITTGGTHVIASAGSLYDAATDEAFSAAEAISSVYEQLHRITTEAGLAGAEVDRRVRESEATRARIETSELLIATETQARAAQYTQLAADIATANGRIAGNASAITGLDTRVATAEGDIVAQASAITSLSTTVGGHTTSISTLATSVGGLEGRWGVAIDIDGGPAGGIALTGLLRNDGTVSSSMAIDVDTLVVGRLDDGGSWISPFIVDSGSVFIDNAVIRDLTTDKITGLDAYFAGELAAASISTDQLTVGSALLTQAYFDRTEWSYLDEEETASVTLVDVGTSNDIYDDTTPFDVVYEATLVGGTWDSLIIVSVTFAFPFVIYPFSAYLQYRKDGDTSWKNLIAFDGPTQSTAGPRIYSDTGTALGIAGDYDVRFIIGRRDMAGGAAEDIRVTAGMIFR